MRTSWPNINKVVVTSTANAENGVKDPSETLRLHQDDAEFLKAQTAFLMMTLRL